VAGQNLVIDYTGVLADAVGPVHGLSVGEIARAMPAVRALIARIEKQRRSGQLATDTAPWPHAYRELPTDKTLLSAVQKAVRRHRGTVDNLVVLGIGGSALGTIALQTALNRPLHNLFPAGKRRGPRLFVMDNIDPVEFADLLDCLRAQLRRTLFNVISKSGETAETFAQFLVVRELLLARLGRQALARHLVVTTDPRSGPLRELAAAEGYDTLPVPPAVGGRFSVLSPVGLFPAAMCGIRVERLLAGAAYMSRRVALTSVRKNPAAMLALLLHAFYVRGKRLHVMMPYSYQLKDLADWYRQLWAESLGKGQDLEGRKVAVGPTPIRALGVTDQHSQVQLYREGPNDKVFIFLEVDKFAADVPIPRGTKIPQSCQYLQGASLGKLLSAEKRATEYALVAAQRPCLTIHFPRVDEHTVGQFIMLWEAVTTLMGGLLNVNPYDQPGVQMGKDFTYALMGRPGYAKQLEEYRRFARARRRYRV